MTTSKLDRYWILSIILLVAIIVVGGIAIWSRLSGSQLVEISMSAAQELEGEIYIGGAVNNPGFYSLKAGDSIDALIQAAGGTTTSADISQLKLYIPQLGEEEQPQKIDINRAEKWLVELLPGIGEARAQAIIDYRQQNGQFGNISELTKVKGIGATTYEQIKHLITVAD